MAKDRQQIVIIFNIITMAAVFRYPSWWIQRMTSILPCCLPFGKTGELQILHC